MLMAFDPASKSGGEFDVAAMANGLIIRSTGGTIGFCRR